MRQQGLTLVELMISMVLGLLLTAGVISLFIQSQQSYNATRDIAILDQNAQVLVDIIERDLNRVGYTPSCRTTPGPNVANMTAINGTTTPFPLIGDRSLQMVGYNQADTNAYLAATTSNVISSLKAGSDYFMVWAPDPEKVGVITARSGSNYTATFSNATDDLNSQVLVITSPDCSQVSQFVQTTSSGSGTEHATVTPGDVGTTANGVSNCSTNMLGNYSCSDSPLPVASATAMPIGGNVMVVDYFGYGITTDDNLIRINAFSGVESNRLLENVTDLQLTFGSTSGTAVQGIFSVERYDTAANVSDWSNVITVRLEFTLQGNTYTAANQKFTKSYTRLITLRNLVIQ